MRASANDHPVGSVDVFIGGHLVGGHEWGIPGCVSKLLRVPVGRQRYVHGAMRIELVLRSASAVACSRRASTAWQLAVPWARAWYWGRAIGQVLLPRSTSVFCSET
ncbi:hypothetical protein BU14_0239s0014 [Porphyra umbilicalis]|uniref:Uncharacterized protein n=1 Tax=Porphyra umbilicalis TaxID=2786 RepID=A0A1X6P3A3_PORUM|nr:hypothetical protein BU14_0239s0014 [Porphyra umbilicalis]|eukprot:OSX75359.1 hypothetical protein BU14_0239s0014 [Porphyra umbilicalis]